MLLLQTGQRSFAARARLRLTLAARRLQAYSRMSVARRWLSSLLISAMIVQRLRRGALARRRIEVRLLEKARRADFEWQLGELRRELADQAGASAKLAEYELELSRLRAQVDDGATSLAAAEADWGKAVVEEKQTQLALRFEITGLKKALHQHQHQLLQQQQHHQQHHHHHQRQQEQEQEPDEAASKKESQSQQVRQYLVGSSGRKH